MVVPASHRVSRVPWYLGARSRARNFSLTGLSPSMIGHSRTIQLNFWFVTLCRFTDPADLYLQHPNYNARMLTWPGFRHFPRSLATTRGITVLFSLPRGTKMVHFPPFASSHLCIQCGIIGCYPDRVAPFGYLRVNACSRLSAAFRSLPRPSSPLSAKASTVCP